jgi:CcmD family protein
VVADKNLVRRRSQGPKVPRSQGAKVPRSQGPRVPRSARVPGSVRVRGAARVPGALRAPRSLGPWVILLVIGIALGFGTEVLGQGPDQMVPISQLPSETIPAAPLVFAAYGFVWAMVIGYVFLLWRRLARVDRDLADVRSRLRPAPRP